MSKSLPDRLIYLVGVAWQRFILIRAEVCNIGTLDAVETPYLRAILARSSSSRLQSLTRHAYALMIDAVFPPLPLPLLVLHLPPPPSYYLTSSSCQFNILIDLL
jgi:hypothetical protein